MDLIDHYLQQRHWRHWSSVFASLPALRGTSVLDLGCGVGDQAAELASRGAHVTGIDMNEQVLEFARSRQVANAQFLQSDVRSLPGDLVGIDGIWASFSAAYVPMFQSVLEGWAAHLRAGGWFALIEIDDLFAQHPLSERTRQYLSSYAEEALAANRYDFRMGRKLREHVVRAGLQVVETLILPDDEFSRQGPVAWDVLLAWQRRLDGMALLRAFCGSAFSQVRDEFLHCLTSQQHRSDARVFCVIARKGGRGRWLPSSEGRK